MPNRIAIYLTALAGLCTALAPVVANLDITSTVGIVGGFAGIAAVVREFLVGWRKYEERIDLIDAGVPGAVVSPGLPGQPPADPSSIPPDEGDADAGRP